MAEIYSDCSIREIANNRYIRHLSLLLFWLGWTTVMLLWQACQTIYSAVFSWSSTLQLGRSLVFNALITSQTLCMPVFIGYVFWVYQVQTGSPRLPSSARHSTPLSLWRTGLCRWYAGEMSSPVVDLQSAGCPTVTPRWPFICHNCRSKDLERSSWRCHVCHIFTNISTKTESTFIVTILPGHYFAIVSVDCHSGPCSFFT